MTLTASNANELLCDNNTDAGETTLILFKDVYHLFQGHNKN